MCATRAGSKWVGLGSGHWVWQWAAVGKAGKAGRQGGLRDGKGVGNAPRTKKGTMTLCGHLPAEVRQQETHNSTRHQHCPAWTLTLGDGGEQLTVMQILNPEHRLCPPKRRQEELGKTQLQMQMQNAECKMRTVEAAHTIRFGQGGQWSRSEEWELAWDLREAAACSKGHHILPQHGNVPGTTGIRRTSAARVCRQTCACRIYMYRAVHLLQAADKANSTACFPERYFVLWPSVLDSLLARIAL